MSESMKKLCQGIRLVGEGLIGIADDLQNGATGAVASGVSAAVTAVKEDNKKSETKTEPVKEEKVSEALTIDEETLRAKAKAIATALAGAGKKDAVIIALKTVGAAKLPEIKVEKLVEFISLIEAVK